MQKGIELSVLPLLCVRSLSHFPKLILFCPPNAGCPGHISGIQICDPFWPVRKPILLGLALSTPAPLFSSLCPPSCPTLSHALNPLTFFFLLSPTFCPSFRVIWWNQILFLGGPRSLLTRSTPPIISPIPTSNNPPAKPCLSCVVPSLSAVFQNFDPPF